MKKYMNSNCFKYPKNFPLAKKLVVVDLINDNIESQIATCAFQGIVNRQSSKKIYITNTYCYDNCEGGENQVQIAEKFLDVLFSDIPTSHIRNYDNKYFGGFLAIFHNFKNYAKGLIIWDPNLEDATIEAATTIAGISDGIPVSPKLAQILKNENLPIIEDLRKYKFQSNPECLNWLLDNWFEQSNHSLAFTWSHMSTDDKSWGAANKDYVTANKLFTFYLDITNSKEKELYSKVITRYEPGTPILGWTDEKWADALFAKMGYFMVPYISVENITVHASFPSTSGEKSIPISAPILENGVYISFFIADGDNLLHSMIYEPEVISSSESFGQVPLTWVINPALVDLSPRLFDWYKKMPKNQELSGMMSDGHPFSDNYFAFKRFCDFTSYYLKKSGIMTLKQMEESEAVAWNVQPYVMNSGYAGICPKGIRPYEYHMDGETFHIGSVKLYNKSETILNLIENSPFNGPLFLNVFIGTAKTDLLGNLTKVVDELKSIEYKINKQFFFLRSVDLAATFRKYSGQPVI
jgi:hypothetical protein